MELEAFELVFLWSTPDRPQLDDETANQIQREHLAFYERLRKAGQVATNGPVVDQPDAQLRGLAFYRVGSLSAARELADGDPAVVAGLLRVEVMTWWCRPGSMVLPGRPITIDP
jgi:uncharacterized protein YciI